MYYVTTAKKLTGQDQGAYLPSSKLKGMPAWIRGLSAHDATFQLIENIRLQLEIHVAYADWNLGQTLFPIAFTGSCLRTLKAGKAYAGDPVFGTDPQPKHMEDLYTGDGDRGGVHINSGIPNHAFYLAAKAPGGYSWEKAGKVWYKTMTSGRIPVDYDFKTFAAVGLMSRDRSSGRRYRSCSQYLGAGWCVSALRPSRVSLLEDSMRN